jgi:glutathione S-transferase
MADSLKSGSHLTVSDCAVIPYILRLELLNLGAMWDRYPAIADWWARVRVRDPWPKVQSLLKAA